MIEIKWNSPLLQTQSRSGEESSWVVVLDPLNALQRAAWAPQHMNNKQRPVLSAGILLTSQLMVNAGFGEVSDEVFGPGRVGSNATVLTAWRTRFLLTVQSRVH